MSLDILVIVIVTSFYIYYFLRNGWLTLCNDCLTCMHNAQRQEEEMVCVDTGTITKNSGYRLPKAPTLCPRVHSQTCIYGHHNNSMFAGVIRNLYFQWSRNKFLIGNSTFSLILPCSWHFFLPLKKPQKSIFQD